VYFLGGLPKADDFFVTLSDKYGKQIERWDGVDISLNARPRTGLTIQGGYQHRDARSPTTAIS
jgi:hypothetical protein